jgi:HK97 family phage major capsid protein
MNAITSQQSLAMRKHANKDLRKIGIADPEAFEPHKLDWSALNRVGSDVMRSARSLIDTIKDDTDPEQAASIETAFDGFIALNDEIEGEKNTRTKIGSRAPRKSGGDPRRPFGDNGAFRGDGSRIHDDDESAVGLRLEQRMADYVRERGAEDHDLSTGAYLRAMVLGAKTDAERRALSEGTDSAGGYTVPEVLSSRMIDLMRARAVVMRAGAVTVPIASDTNHIAKVATDPVPAWRAEAAAVNESGPTFARVTFTPRSLAVLVRVSRELLEDSVNIEVTLPQIIAASMATELDRVAMFGTGTAPQPKGIVNFSGVQTIAHGAALTSYAPLISARTKVKTANHPDVSAYIMSPRDEGTFAGLVDGQDQPLNKPPAIANIPFLDTTAVPVDGGVGTNESTIIAGDFSRLMIGMRSQIRIEILKERYADTGQFGFIAFMRADVAAEYENAFCTITGITP